MSRLLIQHWDREPLPEIVTLSTQAMARYAVRVGAAHQLVMGYPWDKRLSAPCQKLYALSPDLDEFETVVMVDADQFPRAGLTDDIFAETGVGWHHASAQKRVNRHLPHLIPRHGVFFGGAVYRLEREIRKTLRAHYDYEWARVFGSRGCGEDESIFSRLWALAGLPVAGAYLGFEWCWPSFDPNPVHGKFIHVRHHPQDKLTQYRALKAKGFLE